MKEIQGSLDGSGLRVAIVVSRFNQVVTDELVSGATDELGRRGVDPDEIEVIRVPGAWELPAACARVVERGRAGAIIALGAVIRGDTPHFEFVAGEASRGLGALSRESSVPVVFGVLTTDTLEQALERVVGEANKGREAALAALEMANLYRVL
jgi:6,7-dimethyl-8-ribityllumazine synthase